MKNSIFAWLLVITNFNQAVANNQFSYGSNVVAYFAIPFLGIVGKTTWDYFAQGKQEPLIVVNKGKVKKRSSRYKVVKKFLNQLKHNAFYIGIPISILATIFFYVENMTSTEPKNLFSKDVKQGLLYLLPGLCVQQKNNDSNNLELKGLQETIDAFVKRYGSSVKTTTKTVLVTTASGICYVTKEIADLVRTSLH